MFSRPVNPTRTCWDWTQCYETWQWQPSLTVHDPNPPLTLENVVVGAFFGVLRRWTGSAWVKAKLMRYNGASWVPAILKWWDGAQWKEADATGI